METGKRSISGSSFWSATAAPPDFPPLEADAKTDVCVIGAGIAGLTTAYLLMREGLSVVLLESGGIGHGQSSLTTGHLSNALDDRFSSLEKRHGRDGARLAAQSHSAAIDWIEALSLEEGVDCDFERLDGYLFLPPGGDTAFLESERAAARRAGLEADWAVRAPFPSFVTGRCLKFPRQAQFHPTKYLAGLAGLLHRGGVRIFTGTHAAAVEGGASARVTTRPGPAVFCRAVVVATNVPVNDLLAIHTKQAAYNTYVIAAPIPKGAVPRALFWDTADPYHYVRTQYLSRTEDLLIVGGEDHKTGQADDIEERYRALEGWARERASEMGKPEYRWCGQVMEPMDGLAFIGRNPGEENVYVVTGDSGNGLTHGTLAGILLKDLILGRPNPWAGLYDPARVNWRSSGDFIRENANVLPHYADWVTPGQVRSEADIPPGTGAVLRRGLAKHAVYRDEAGALHETSAVCPHLGCIVRWNGGEKTWDCPCHGSRFDAEGAVIHGPANRGLDAVKAPEPAHKAGGG